MTRGRNPHNTVANTELYSPTGTETTGVVLTECRERLFRKVGPMLSPNNKQGGDDPQKAERSPIGDRRPSQGRHGRGSGVRSS